MYFRKFPRIQVDGVTGTTGGSKMAVDILRRAGFTEKGITSSEYFFKYDISDGETPESLAHRMYGSPEYHWIILMFNDIIDPLFEWPLESRKFEKHIKKKYIGTTLFLGEGITGTFKVGDTVGLINSGVVGGDTGFGALVENYNPTLRKLTVSGLLNTEEFNSQDYIQSYNSSGGTAWHQNVGGATIERIVLDSTQAIHHFGISGSITGGYDSIGGGTATSSIILDPLSQYSSNGQTGLGPDGITFADTLLYGYIFNSTNDYVITNENYEKELNESKNTISLMRPEVVPQVLEEFKTIMGK